VVGDILQPTHLIFVLVVALLVLGPKRLPEVGRALGRGLRDFRSAISGEEQPRPDQVAQQTTAPTGQTVYDPQPAYRPQPVAQPEPDHRDQPVQPAPEAEPVHEHAEHTG
jgi:sec-independent protein translocase protein TatA